MNRQFQKPTLTKIVFLVFSTCSHDGKNYMKKIELAMVFLSIFIFKWLRITKKDRLKKNVSAM